MITELLKDESGVTMIEYAMVAALIAAVCITVVSLFGLQVSNQYSSANRPL